MTAKDRRDFRAAARGKIGVGAAALLVILGVFAVAAAAVSPVILNMVYPANGTDHVVAGDVGQAHGAASALVATAVLIAVPVSVFVQARRFRSMGVVASLRVQAAQHRSDRVLPAQQRHLGMMKYVFDDSMYGQCFRPEVASTV
jgi:hypothetical protein